MKYIGFCILAVMLTAVSAGSYAQEKVNGKESLRSCKAAYVADMPEDVEYRFKQKTATSVNVSSFKHWINLYEVSEDKKIAKKLLCETSRTGEILVLQVRDGKWRI